LAAVDAGQVQVEQDQVGLELLGGLGVGQPGEVVQRLTPVRDDGQPVGKVSLAQRALDDLRVGPTVLDQQDVEFRTHAALGSPLAKVKALMLTGAVAWERPRAVDAASSRRRWR